MSKFLAGCLVATVVLVGGAGLVAYLAWDYVRPIVGAVTGVTEGVRRLGEVTDLDRDLVTTASYEAPASGELTEAQVERFIRVQTAVRLALGERGEAFAAKYREISRNPDGSPAIPSLPDLLGALADLSDVYLEAWRAQVGAMNAEGFSRDEFSWVRLRVYQAAGLDAVRYDARDLERVIASMARGVQLEVPPIALPDAPSRNRELVKPHLPLLSAWLAQAVFGL